MLGVVMIFVVVQFVLLGLLAVAVLEGTGQPLFPHHPAWTVLGFLLAVLAGALAVAAFWSLGRSFRVAPAPKQQATLVTNGIYGTLRHPMYTAVVSLVCGVFLLRPTWAIGLSAAAIVVFYVVKARYEEGLLAARYPEYRKYKARTRGVIPFG